MKQTNDWYYDIQKVHNGYEFKLYDKDDLLVGILYGSTNAMWDLVPGVKATEAYVKSIIKHMNNQT